MSAQQPEGTHRVGIGPRPYASYSILQEKADNKLDQVGLTRRVTEDGKTRWQGENTANVTSPLFDIHRDAVIWLVDGTAPEAPVKKTPAKKSAKKAPATSKHRKQSPEKSGDESSPKAPTTPDSTPEQPDTASEPDLTATLKASLEASKSRASVNGNSAPVKV